MDVETAARLDRLEAAVLELTEMMKQQQSVIAGLVDTLTKRYPPGSLTPDILARAERARRDAAAR